VGTGVVNLCVIPVRRDVHTVRHCSPLPAFPLRSMINVVNILPPQGAQTCLSDINVNNGMMADGNDGNRVGR